jgi:hypothetical protein
MKSQPFEIGRIYKKDVLQDGEIQRTPLMLKDAAAFCRECGGLGRFKDASIRCPFCKGSGLANSNGEGIDEIVSATSNEIEGARSGEFGTDRASINDAEMRDRLAKDAAWREASIGNRCGFRIDHSAEGKAARQKVFDAIAKADEERENACALCRVMSIRPVSPLTPTLIYVVLQIKLTVGRRPRSRKIIESRWNSDIAITKPPRRMHTKLCGNTSTGES